MPHAIVDSQYESEVLKSDIPVILDFWAPWCSPCKTMIPIFEELEKEYEGKVKFTKMNVDENIDTPGKFNVMSIPTFIIFKKGKAVGTIVGARPKDAIKQELDAALA